MGRHPSLDLGCGLCKSGESELRALCTPAFIFSVFDCGCDCFCCPDFTTMMDLNLKSWTKITLFFPEMSLSGYFVTATGNEIRTQMKWHNSFWESLLRCSVPTRDLGCSELNASFVPEQPGSPTVALDTHTHQFTSFLSPRIFFSFSSIPHQL